MGTTGHGACTNRIRVHVAPHREVLPRQTAKCATSGCGPGRYSIELAKRGYRVTCFDLSVKLLERAEGTFASEGINATAFVQGDARDLGVFEDESFDGALLLGPLYHMVERPNRSQALSEMVRILKPGGTAIVAFLNAWGLLRTGVAGFPHLYRNPSFLRSLLGETTFEDRERPNFTECHWANPDIACKELRGMGLRIVSYAGAEGFVGGMAPLLETLRENEPAAYENVEAFAAETSELASVQRRNKSRSLCGREVARVDSCVYNT